MTVGMAEALPFTVIGGCLGAGKTAPLNHLISPADLASLHAAWLTALAPATPVVETVQSEVATEVPLGSGRGCASEAIDPVDDHRPEHRSAYGT